MSQRTPHPRPAAAGFTFVEVLFAIIILGVGTIMLAGMLPVAIKQSSDTRNDLTGRSVCEAGLAYVQTVAAFGVYGMPATDTFTGALTALDTGTNFPGRIVPLSHSVVEGNAGPTALQVHQSLYGSRIFTSDPRFQWLAFYGRAEGSNVAKVIVLALRLQNADLTPAYSPATITQEQINAGNGPMLAEAEIIDGGALDADRIVFDAAAPAAAIGSGSTGAADTGAFVIVATSENTTGDAGRSQRNSGRVFRLGARRLDLDGTGYTFDLQPGFDLGPASIGADNKPNTADDVADGSMNTLPTSDPAGGYPAGAAGAKVAGGNVQVWLVGRGRLDPTAVPAPGDQYGGPVQDISVLSVDLPLK